LLEEIARLREAVKASADAEAKARLVAQEAEEARLVLAGQAANEAQDRSFWETQAAEMEAALRELERKLEETQAKASAAPGQQLDLLAQAAIASSENIEIDEATTRVLIDDQLRAAGWKVDSALLRYGNGTRPGSSESIAIAEWPTDSGPGRLCACSSMAVASVSIEAKRANS
jgi:type I restriction enzyme R subunit